MQRVNPGGQLRRGKRLGDIIVCTEHQAVDLVHLLAFGGEHHNAQRRRTLTQLLADRKAVETGHHYIENHNVERLLRVVIGCDGVEAVVNISDLVAGPLEVDYHKVADGFLIFGNQDVFHMQAPFSPRGGGWRLFNRAERRGSPPVRS